MRAVRGTLVSVDGVDASQIVAAARAKLAAVPRSRRGGVSVWDASGVFDDLVVAGGEAGIPSPRTLLLLYAADLAFRLRWEIRPALAEGRIVAAAPYVATAVAFGRAAGLPAGWIRDLFRFAPRPTEACYVDAPAPRSGVSGASGFLGFACGRLAERGNGAAGSLIDRARGHLRAAAKRRRA